MLEWLADFADRDFIPYVETASAGKPNTVRFYKNSVNNLKAMPALASLSIDAITSEHIGAYVAQRKASGLEVSTVNRDLATLRRMFHLAQEWQKVTTVLPRVKLLPGENRRERVLTSGEETAESKWTFPAPTKSGHIEASTIKKQHAHALTASKVRPFVLCCLRHTAISRWAKFIDAYTLRVLAGHTDFNTTARYIHANDSDLRESMERARLGLQRVQGSDAFVGTSQNGDLDSPSKPAVSDYAFNELSGATRRDRTGDLLITNQPLYQLS